MSDINFLGINENFPVPGEDNDTQVFRDNFDTIKQSLRIAGEEITDLQDNVARTDVDNDFNNKLIQNAVLQSTTERKLDGGNIQTANHTIDFENGSYQIFRFAQDTTIQFQNLPDNSSIPAGVGIIKLEIYALGLQTQTSGFFETGRIYTIISVGTTDFTKIGSPNNTPGTVFIASNNGLTAGPEISPGVFEAGNGTALKHWYINFSTVGGTVIKRSQNFPATLSIDSTETSGGGGDPYIIEAWAHSSDRIFLNYLGQFSS